MRNLLDLNYHILFLAKVYFIIKWKVDDSTHSTTRLYDLSLRVSLYAQKLTYADFVNRLLHVWELISTRLRTDQKRLRNDRWRNDPHSFQARAMQAWELMDKTVLHCETDSIKKKNWRQMKKVFPLEMCRYTTITKSDIMRAPLAGQIDQAPCQIHYNNKLC